MAAFLTETLEQLLRYFCSKFVKKDVMSKASTASKLIKIDLGENNLVSVTNLGLGFGITIFDRNVRLFKRKKPTQICVC